MMQKHSLQPHKADTLYTVGRVKTAMLSWAGFHSGKRNSVIEKEDGGELFVHGHARKYRLEWGTVELRRQILQLERPGF